ncbi:MAG: fused MFS/spermidine synthase [Opitutaceae bacterium]
MSKLSALPPAATAPSAALSSSSRVHPLLLLLFVGSGCAALIYEIVWFQMLQLAIGSSAVSLGVLLGTFMGGMCAGSYGLSRVVAPDRHPLRVYAVLEVGIAVCGIVALFAIPQIGKVYSSIVGPGLANVFMRGVVAAICLLPPTFMMGATLPAIARWVEATPKGVSSLGFFYAGNTAGAVIGCFAAGFYLLRVHDIFTATWVAVALNVGVAAIAYLVAASSPHRAIAASETSRLPRSIPPEARAVYATIAISGFTALGAEVVWTRLLTLVLGGTTYTFSMILGVFLTGIGLGSTAGSYIARHSPAPRRALGIAQFFVVAAVGWTAWNLVAAMPYWPINPSLASTPWRMMQIDLVRCVWAILPAACLWGASFPLALAAVATKGDDTGRTVGGVYAANTIGAILGALAFSIVLIPWLGTQQAQRILVGVAAAGALLAFARYKAWAATTLLLAGVLVWNLPKIPALLVAYGRYAATWQGQHGEFIYMGEGLNSSMAVSRNSDGALNYHNAGKVQASSLPQDMRLQRMLGHLTTLLPRDPKDVLVIACGAGVTAGAVSINPQVQHQTIAEIEPLVPTVVSEYFGDHNYHVVKNPKVRVHVDDARHFLLTTKEKFDGITSDPFDPWVKGAATLYTREFWEIAKAHLKPGGVVTVFVQLYESGMPAVKSEIATFFEAFPDGVVFGNTHGGQGYDIVLVGQVGKLQIDVDEMEARLARPDFAIVRQSLAEIGFNSAQELLSTFGGQAADLAPWLKDAQVNRDRNLRLQYLAGLGLNAYEQAKIYSEILAHRKIPEDLFVGSPAKLTELKAAILARQ